MAKYSAEGKKALENPTISTHVRALALLRIPLRFETNQAAPCAAVLDRLTIGEDAVIGLDAVVVISFPADTMELALLPRRWLAGPKIR